ncbi:MAG: hypothetical protein OSA95_03950, partial [Opitutales bacterium]|nr:hypothetical protein [Opitutales bacterium]
MVESHIDDPHDEDAISDGEGFDDLFTAFAEEDHKHPGILFPCQPSITTFFPKSKKKPEYRIPQVLDEQVRKPSIKFTEPVVSHTLEHFYAPKHVARTIRKPIAPSKAHDEALKSIAKPKLKSKPKAKAKAKSKPNKQIQTEADKAAIRDCARKKAIQSTKDRQSRDLHAAAIQGTEEGVRKWTPKSTEDLQKDMQWLQKDREQLEKRAAKNLDARERMENLERFLNENADKERKG